MRRYVPNVSRESIAERIKQTSFGRQHYGLIRKEERLSVIPYVSLRH
ncbi:hypothetical protein [Bacillus sp. UMB0893]|nr:hypothetical protein [Bacillus sp. UMB0893]